MDAAHDGGDRWGGMHRISNVSKIEVSPRVNPKTGSDLLFISGRSGRQQLWRMNLDGTDREMLTTNEGDVSNPSWSPDGHHIAVRTYSQVFIFATDSVTGSVNHAVEPRVCDLTGLGEAQGEGVSWINDRGRLVFTSEGRRAPLNLGDCPP